MLMDTIDSLPDHIPDLIMPVRRQKGLAERPAVTLPPGSMRAGVPDRKYARVLYLVRHFSIPGSLHEVRSKAVDLCESRCVVDRDFIRSDADVGPILLEQAVDIMHLTTGDGGCLQRKIGEAREPWSRDLIEIGVEPFG